MSALIFLVIGTSGEEIYSVFYLNWLIIRGFYLNLWYTNKIHDKVTLSFL